MGPQKVWNMSDNNHPANSPIITVGWLQKAEKVEKREKSLNKTKKSNCVIADQYLRCALQPDVSTPSGRWCFPTSRTDRQTDTQTDIATL